MSFQPPVDRTAVQDLRNQLQTGPWGGEDSMEGKRAKKKQAPPPAPSIVNTVKKAIGGIVSNVSNVVSRVASPSPEPAAPAPVAAPPSTTWTPPVGKVG